jgi:DNA-binding NarL/FixJ family response regulator
MTVVLGDDQAGTRAGVRRALEPGGLRIVAEAATGEEAVAAALRHRPAVCVLAIHMPGDGIAAAKKIKGALPDTKIVMLTGSDRAEDLFASLRAGADGYVLKTVSLERLPEEIRGVLAGEATLPPHLTARLIEEYRNFGRRRTLPPSVADRPVAVTARQFEVLTRLRAGETTAEIANELRISEVTVRRHVSKIMHKLGAQDRHSGLARIKDAELDQLDGQVSASEAIACN